MSGGSMVCCPLSASDGDGPECSTTVTPRARKEHRCVECRETIKIGARYEKTSGIWDGSPNTYRTCLSCTEIRDHFQCDGFYYGQLWSDLEENFFPDMTAGGPCMDGMSPEARARLIDARMTWYFAQGEINDAAWEEWPKNRDVQRAPRAMPDPEKPVAFWDRPEVYWPERLKREALMREYEQSKETEQ